MLVDLQGAKHWGTVLDFDIHGIDLLGVVYENRGEEGCLRMLGAAPFRLEWRFVASVKELYQ